MALKARHKVFVVVNPVSGGGLGRRLWPGVAKELKVKFGSFDFEETSAIGDARLIAHKVTQAGYQLILSYGGDGTIHEVVNGIYDAKAVRRPVVGILCVGTGGDLIKTLGIPKKISDQIKIVSGLKSRIIDIGRVKYTKAGGQKESRYFVNIADAGIGAEVVRRLRYSRRLFGRKMAYLTSTLESCLLWKPKEIQIESNHSHERRHPDPWPKKSLSIVVANGRYFGGGMPIAPLADPSDGLLDLVVIGEMGLLHSLLAVPLLYSKQLIRLPAVHFDRARKITLSSESKVDLDIDGEPVGSLPATFTIIPKALTIKSPALFGKRRP